MKKRLRFLPLAQEGGQTLVEFALTITVTLMLIFGLIEFARAVYTMSVVQWAAQQGARAGIAVESNLQATVEAAVEERLIGLDAEKAVIIASQPE
ncbi:MAG TPA: TadE family protein, partial [Caldilineaceae bacterium]|nr:TadE family protein [Caldilineaceae bacterium]